MTRDTQDRPETGQTPPTRQISLRVDSALVERFLAARRICEAHGKRLPIDEVVRVGMEAAIREVETTFGEEVPERPAPAKDEIPPRPGALPPSGS